MAFSNVFHKKELLWMSVIYLIMTCVNTMLLYPIGVGSSLPYLGLIFFGGFGFSQKNWHLIASFLLFFGSIVLLICSFWLFLKRKKSQLLVFTFILDWSVSTIWMLISNSFDIKRILLSTFFYVIFLKLLRTEKNCSIDEDQK